MQSHSVTAPSTPGPGQYPAERQFWSKSSLHRIRGRFVAVKTHSLNAVFKSGTERQLDKELRHTIRENLPSAAQYRDNRGIGELSVQGGAPNNFLLLQNERVAVPFNSSCAKTDIASQQLTNCKCFYQLIASGTDPGAYFKFGYNYVQSSRND
jgi:hypothetical protein